MCSLSFIFQLKRGGGPELIDAVGINYIFEGFPKLNLNNEVIRLQDSENQLRMPFFDDFFR